MPGDPLANDSLADLVVVSNRGPLSFRRASDGTLVANRGAGGVVSALRPLLAGTDALWIAAAVGADDQAAAKAGLMEAEGLRLRSLAVDPATYRMFYDVVSNATLWYLHHGLFDLGRRPRFDRSWRKAWEAYREVNDEFARIVAETAPESAVVLVQDYHLALVAGRLSALRPDVRSVHFAHTPFAGPEAVRVLPEDVAAVVFEGMAAHRACGFHSRRWAECYAASSRSVLGRSAPTFVAPLGPDEDDLLATASSEACLAERAKLDASIGERQLILRVDRVEPSKNLVRGFLAFDALLRERQDLRGRVVLVALAYASRQGLADYLAYRTEVEVMADRVNSEWSDGDWTPVVLDVDDNYTRSVAALTRYDVLLVNPIRDGLNLVAKEGPMVNEREGALVLSREAGAWDELQTAAIGVNPFDLEETTAALSSALDLAGGARAERAGRLRTAAASRDPRSWLADQLRVARSP